MAKKKASINNKVIVEGEPVSPALNGGAFPTMPLERVDTLSEIYPDLFFDVPKKRKWNIPVKRITIAIVLLTVASYLVYYFNVYVNLQTTIDAQKAQIDSELQRRADLVPNLVRSMESYTVYENQLVSHLAEVRSTLVNERPGINKKGGKNSSASKPMRSFEDAISRLLAIVESYPDLKASAAFQTLMTQLAETENRIAEQRVAYNRAAMLYNNRLKSIPGFLLALLFRLKPVKYFEVDEALKKLPSVELDLTKLQK